MQEMNEAMERLDMKIDKFSKILKKRLDLNLTLTCKIIVSYI